MILKKPYAFLIKHFKLIHLILSLFLFYTLFKSSKILEFFNDYLKLGFFKFQNNIAGSYINTYLFIVVIFIIIVGLVIYTLMKVKKKNRVFYISLIVFYLIVFGAFIYLFNEILSMESILVDKRIIRIDRDLSILVLIPQFFFLVYSILRGIGFDVKKFNFNKDLEELDITIDDNEEFEFIVGKDGYKTKRKIRRSLREIKYYILENKFLFCIILVFISLIVGLLIYLNFQVFNKTYNQNQDFTSSLFKMNVNKSFITNKSYNGDVINNKYYLVVDMNIKNNGLNSEKLNPTNFRIVLNNKNIYPTLNKNKYFIDLGKGYYNEELKVDNNNILFIYELEKKDLRKNYNLRIVNKINLIKGELSGIYKDVLLKPLVSENIKILENKKLGDEIFLGRSNLDKAVMKFNYVTFGNSFNESYNYCIGDYCYKGIEIIKPDLIGSNNRIIMKVDLNFMPDINNYLSNFVYYPKHIVEYFGSINYELKGINKNSYLKNITPKYLTKNINYYEVDKGILEAEKINLYITIRNSRYIINIK